MEPFCLQHFFLNSYKSVVCHQSTVSHEPPYATLCIVFPFVFPVGTRSYQKVPAGWNYCSHGDRRQHQYRPGSRQQMWHPGYWRQLLVFGRQRVQPTDLQPTWTGRRNKKTNTWMWMCRWMWEQVVWKSEKTNMIMLCDIYVGIYTCCNRLGGVWSLMWPELLISDCPKWHLCGSKANEHCPNQPQVTAWLSFIYIVQVHSNS